MDLKELLLSHRYYSILDDDKNITYHWELRDSTSAEHLEFRRRSAKVKLKNGKVESSDEALQAPFWLLDKIRIKLEVSNGTAERFEVPDDLYKDVTQEMKQAAIQRYLTSTQGEEVELQKN